VSAVIAWVAWQAGTLTSSGAVAAWTVGSLVLYGAGWNGGAVLAAFFISSNLVSRLGMSRASTRLDTQGDRRNIWQVYANGAIAALGAVIASGEMAVWLVTATLAAAAADTWATEIGARSDRAPRLLAFGRSVPPGTSGGMSLIGSAGALAGAAMVSGTGALLTSTPAMLPVGTLVGFAGMLVDSMLGAAFQGRFHCSSCNEGSERRVHRCGHPTLRVGGLSWMDNDLVNLLATTTALATALLSWRLLD
jgi:uncharacterized protein (TIGR00297 family)